MPADQGYPSEARPGFMFADEVERDAFDADEMVRLGDAEDAWWARQEEGSPGKSAVPLADQEMVAIDPGRHLYDGAYLPPRSITTALCGAVFRTRGGYAVPITDEHCVLCITVCGPRRAWR